MADELPPDEVLVIMPEPPKMSAKQVMDELERHDAIAAVVDQLRDCRGLTVYDLQTLASIIAAYVDSPSLMITIAGLYDRNAPSSYLYYGGTIIGGR